MHNRNRKIIQRKQSGMVMIMLLMIFALAAVLATELSYNAHRDIRRTDNLISQNEAYLYALGGESFAIQKLLLDGVNDKALGIQADHLQEAWAMETSPLAVDAENDEQGIGEIDLEIEDNSDEHELGNIEIVIEDLQARFNVNNVTLKVKNQKPGKDQLLDVINANKGDEIELDNPADIVSAILDWVDEDSDSSTFTGGEDDYYQTLDQAYRTGNQDISHISELKAVKGMQAETFLLFNNLVPKLIKVVMEEGAEGEEGVDDTADLDNASFGAFDGDEDELDKTGAQTFWGEKTRALAALPKESKINLNTAPASVLVALFSEQDANTIVANRENNFFNNVNDALQLLPEIKPKDYKKFKDYLSVNSQFFQVTSIATIGDYTFVLQSKLYRSTSGEVKVIARDFSQTI